MLLAGAFAFGGVYLWASIARAACVGALLAIAQPRLARGPLRVADISLATLLGLVLVQLVSLPAPVVSAISPARASYLSEVALQAGAPPRLAPLALDAGATFHAWTALFCIIGAFWAARRIFERGGVRTFSLVVACGAILIALLAFAQHASGTALVYGIWRPRDAGARPLGPFINRNHLGTWSIMAICLCVGYLQWRGGGEHARLSWRQRASRIFDGRALLLLLAIVLLASVVALGASRSALVALACAGGYLALAGPGQRGRRSLAGIGALALIGMLAYGDGPRLLLRIDETQATGMSGRLAIWRDALPLLRDFPLTGVGAGNFGIAMRVYQTTPRTYYHNEAHNQFIQIVTEGGVLLSLPAAVALVALLAAASAALRRRNDPMGWMRVAAAGGLVGVAVQSFWETGLTLPANGMFAAALAALLVHDSPVRPPSSAPVERR